MENRYLSTTRTPKAFLQLLTSTGVPRYFKRDVNVNKKIQHNTSWSSSTHSTVGGHLGHDRKHDPNTHSTVGTVRVPVGST
jgi:hypothetical protein